MNNAPEIELNTQPPDTQQGLGQGQNRNRYEFEERNL